jgi:hypothetical protein
MGEIDIYLKVKDIPNVTVADAKTEIAYSDEEMKMFYPHGIKYVELVQNRDDLIKAYGSNSDEELQMRLSCF